MKNRRVGAAFPGRNPAAPVASGEGEVGEELEETEVYPFVGPNEVGDGQRCAPRGEQWAAATASRGRDAPVRGSGGGVVGELHRAMGKLSRGLARAEEGWKGGLRGGSSDGGGHGDGGGVPGRRGGWGELQGFLGKRSEE